MTNYLMREENIE